MAKIKNFNYWWDQGYCSMDDAWFADSCAVYAAVKRIAERAYNRGKKDAKAKQKQLQKK